MSVRPSPLFTGFQPPDKTFCLHTQNFHDFRAEIHRETPSGRKATCQPLLHHRFGHKGSTVHKLSFYHQENALPVENVPQKSIFSAEFASQCFPPDSRLVVVPRATT